MRALVHDPAKADRVRELGADETVAGDLRDRASIDADFDGVDAVFHVTPAFAPDSAELGVSMVEAATAAGVDRFVFSGVYHRSLSLGEPRACMRPIEEALLVGEGGLLARLTKRVVEAGDSRRDQERLHRRLCAC